MIPPAQQSRFFVSPSDIERAIRITVASLEMEGFTVDSAHVALCRKMLAGEITMEECLAAVMAEIDSAQNLNTDFTS